jgi:hypothetical protein
LCDAIVVEGPPGLQKWRMEQDVISQKKRRKYAGFDDTLAL